MIEWEKPNKNKATTNSNPKTIEAAESLGWKRVVKRRAKAVKNDRDSE